MKKVLMIGLIIALVLIFVGGAGVVYARVRGFDEKALVTINTVKDKAVILRQSVPSQGVIITGNGPCVAGPQGEFGLRTGPGFMMQGSGPGWGLGGYGNGACPGGMMGGYGNGFGRGMMNGRAWGVMRGKGLMHDYMISAFAEAVALTVEELEARLSEGESFKEIAIAQGFTQDELKDLVTQVRQAALDAAVADEVITQEQADFMLERMEKFMDPDFGPGFWGGYKGCPMWDGDEFPQP